MCLFQYMILSPSRHDAASTNTEHNPYGLSARPSPGGLLALNITCGSTERSDTSTPSGRGQQLSGRAGAHQRPGKRERENSLGMVRPAALRVAEVS